MAETSLLDKLPGEIRNEIWKLLCTPLPCRPNRERAGPTTGILNCNKHLCQEFSSFLFHQNSNGEIPDLTIVITNTCRKGAWLSLAIEPKCAMSETCFHFDERIDKAGCFDVNDMENPVFDVLREAKQINMVHVRFDGPWFVNEAPLYSLPGTRRARFGEDPIYDAEAFWRQWDVPFLSLGQGQGRCSAARVFQSIGKMTIYFNDWRRDRRRDEREYWHAIPLYTSVTNPELRNPVRVWRLLMDCFLYGDGDGTNLLNLGIFQCETLFGIITFPTKKNPEWGMISYDYHGDGLADQLKGVGPIEKPQTLEETHKHHINRLSAAFASLLEQQSDDIYDIWALREHRAATLDSSARNFFHRLQHEEKYPVS